jgi:ankyrin repeat protein
MSITKFEKAVREGNVKLATKYLNDKKFSANEINLKYENQRTLLQIAMINNDIEMIKILLNHPFIENIIDVNSKDIEGNTSLLYIFEFADPLNILKILLKNKKIDLYSSKNKIIFEEYTYLTDYIYYNVLFYAIEYDNLDVIKFLIDKYNFNDLYGILLFATYNNKEDIVYYLVNHEKININEEFASHWLDGTKIKTISFTSLTMASAYNNTNIVKILFENNNLDVNEENDYFYGENNCFSYMNSLSIAIINNNLKLINLLLTHPNIYYYLNLYISDKNTDSYNQYSKFLSLLSLTNLI